MKGIKATPSRGASNAFKGITEGVTGNHPDKYGCSGSFKKLPVASSTKDDPTVSAKTIVGSTAIPQHKRLAMGGKL